MGVPKHISKGILSNIVTTKEDGVNLEFYVTDSLCIFGNSGGGLYNESAELIGVPALVLAYNKVSAVTNMGFCISLDTIKKFLGNLL